jgi:serpin B
MRRVALGFPRFRLSGHFSLAPTLSSLGIRAAFDPSAADFSGVDGTRELFISGVVHQAELVVDENGTEAAAATAIVALGGAAPPASKPVAFTADHPFVIVLRDEQTGTNVFVGRVADPSDGASPAPPPPPPPPPSPSPGPALACQTDADCPTRACGPCGHGDVVTTDDLRRACVVNPCPSAKATCRKGTCVIR